MTREEIMEMDEEALNRAIHKELFGYDWLPFFSPNYSADISAAWKVEERIKELNLQTEYTYKLIDITLGGFTAIHATPSEKCKAALLTMID